MDTAAFKAYFLEGGHTEVVGWVAPGALTAMYVLMRAQEEFGVTGHIGEIGVHHGRYFLAMAALSRSSERLVAIDIFEDQHLNIDKSGLGDRGQFLANVASHGPADAARRLSVVKADSTKMRPAQLRDAALGRYRFFSVDGGHTVHHVMNDIALAEATLADGGIVSVDDFFNADWPGIAEGLVRYATEVKTSLVPLFYGDNKLYLVQEGWAERYWHAVESQLAARAEHSKRTEFLGRPVSHIRFRPPEAQPASDRVVRGLLWSCTVEEPDNNPSVRFEAGWSPLAKGVGRWSLGRGARVSIAVAELLRDKPARLMLHGYPFAGRQAKRAMTVRVDDGETLELSLPEEPCVLSVPLPTRRGESIELRLDHLPVGSPLDAGHGADHRDLGLLVTRIEVEIDA